MLDDYFNVLEEWKKLPSYKLETRIDSLVGYALPGVLEELLKVKARAIIPELPLRVGTIYEKRKNTRSANRSYKVDFYVRSADGKNLFVEFKSDTGSRREEQDRYLQLAAGLGMEKAVDGILTLSRASPYKAKYQHLLDKLAQGGVLDQEQRAYIGDNAVRVIYIQPMRLPTDGSKEIIDFRRLATAIRTRYGTWDVMLRFAESLDTWGVTDA